MKKNIFFGILLLLMFFLGMITKSKLIKNNYDTQNKLQINILVKYLDQNNSLLFYELDNIYSWFKVKNADTSSYEFLLIKNAVNLKKYFDGILISNKKLKEFDPLIIENIVKEDYNVDELIQLSKEFNINNNSDELNRLYVSLCENIMINNYLKLYREKTLMIKNANCMVISDNDTLKFGDNYKGQIYFTIKDLANRDNIIMENGKRLKDGIYSEIATQRGLNKRKGTYEWFNGNKTLLFPIEFSFYVK